MNVDEKSVLLDEIQELAESYSEFYMVQRALGALTDFICDFICDFGARRAPLPHYKIENFNAWKEKLSNNWHVNKE